MRNIGGSWKYCGGTYGGTAGVWSVSTYGCSNAPMFPGSAPGGGYNWSSGGLILLEVKNSVLLNGVLTADGTNSNNRCGSGGGIYLRCRTFQGGATSELSADGGGHGASGYPAGGGRIAIWRVSGSHSGSAAADPGATYGGYNAGAGTVVLGQFPDMGYSPANVSMQVMQRRTEHMAFDLWNQGTNGTAFYSISSTNLPLMIWTPSYGSLNVGQTGSITASCTATGVVAGIHDGMIIVSTTNRTMDCVEPYSFEIPARITIVPLTRGIIMNIK